MDPARFDALLRVLAQRRGRRAVLPILGSLFAIAALDTNSTSAKKKKKKKITLCLDGQTIQASKKKKKKFLKSGATPGGCPPPAPPPPPPTLPPCAPTCAGKPCGADDGCGTPCGCASGKVCDDGVCQTCTLTCNGSSITCGADLQSALDEGGTIYACPGRYTDNFQIDTANVKLVGAGPGDDPATSTILDGNQVERVVHVESGFTVELQGLRITGGTETGPGAGIRNEGTLTVKRCTITGNTTTSGSCGVQQNAMATGPLALIDSTISNNSCDLSGGGIGQANPNQAVSLTNCTVSGNKAGVNGDGNGGGINCGEGIVNVIGGSITGNSADDGGGIFSTAPDSVILSGVTVSGNSPNQCNANVSC